MSGPQFGHCDDLNADRALGEYWENVFVEMAAQERSAMLTRNQKGNRDAAHAEYLSAGLMKRCLLPDVVVWTMPGEHHEIKHKDPTKWSVRKYGLEVYRFDALVEFAGQLHEPVMYTIHDWERAGGDKHARANDLAHWRTVNVLKLAEYTARTKMTPETFPKCWSWRNGERSLEPMYYWPASRWISLAQFWRDHQPRMWGA